MPISEISSKKPSVECLARVIYGQQSEFYLTLFNSWRFSLYNSNGDFQAIFREITTMLLINRQRLIQEKLWDDPYSFPISYYTELVSLYVTFSNISFILSLINMNLWAFYLEWKYFPFFQRVIHINGKCNWKYPNVTENIRM